VTAYAVAPWVNLFLGGMGASAALLGLIFVGMSINLVKITAEPTLSERGLEAIVLLASVLLVSIVTLVPQPRQALGIEVTVLGLCQIAVPGLIYAFVLRNIAPRYRRSFLLHVALGAAAAVPVVVAGASLWLEAGGGLYWLVLAMLFAFVASITEAWVLLVEIVR